MFKHIKYKDKEKERYLITLARSIKLFFISLFLIRMYKKRSSMISPCLRTGIEQLQKLAARYMTFII